MCIGGSQMMTENDTELINLIRDSVKPEQALMTAAVIIVGYLKQLESYPAASSDALQAHA